MSRLASKTVLRGLVAVVVGDDPALLILPNPDARVRRTEVDADCWCHAFELLWLVEVVVVGELL